MKGLKLPAFSLPKLSLPGLKRASAVGGEAPAGDALAAPSRLVLNIPGGNDRHIMHGAELRRSASAAGVPCLHSISAAWAVANSLTKNLKGNNGKQD